MSSFSNGKLALGICGLCGMSVPYPELIEDGNVKGLYVERSCRDQIDPYKLPPAPPDSFVLHHPRPDLPLDDLPTYLLNDDGTLFYDNNGQPILAS